MAFQADNKKIAKNTIILYMRQILIMVITLYTSRVVLQTLGAEDYGIYNVVGGFVTMFNVISGAFTVAISRFMAYVIGEGDEKRIEELFSTALVVQCCMGIFIVLLLATVGVWYVTNIMVLPAGRTEAALWVLAFSAVSFFINLISVPYNALIVAHEHMKAYAYIAVFEAVMKLLVSFAIVISPFDKLITYSFLTVLSAIIVRFCYSVYCNKNFTGCKFKLRVHKNTLKEMMSFVGWAFLGNGAVVLRDQGTNMILNFFGGTVVNAARGIAQNVNNAVQSFVNNFMQATQPEITKLKATDQLPEMRALILRSCRVSYFLMLILSIPLIKNINYILAIWLGEVPDYTNLFVAFTLIDSLIAALNNPLLYGVLATGQIKLYEIVMSAMCILSLPINYWLLSLGITPAYVYIVIVIIRFLTMLSLVWQSKTYGLKWRDFIQQVAIRGILTTAICVTIADLISFSFIGMAFLRFLMETGSIVLLNGCAIFMIGLSKKERNLAVSFIRTKIIPRFIHKKYL